MAMRCRCPPGELRRKTPRGPPRRGRLRPGAPDARGERRPAKHALDSERFRDLVAGAHSRVQGGLWILKDDLQIPPLAPQRAPGKGEPVDAVEKDPARVGVLEARDEAPDRRLAAPRLSDEGERSALRRIENETRSTAEIAPLAARTA